jgi:beta-glucanase (GH16 family)
VRLIAGALVAALVAIGLVFVAARGGGTVAPASQPPGAAATDLPSGTPSSDTPSSGGSLPIPNETGSPAVGRDGYTFDDEFDGSSLNAVWLQHFNFDGIENSWALSQANVANGLLAITASRTADGWVSSLLDTKTTWTQQYGYFEARMKIPEGTGLWPAFWSYHAGGPGGQSEIDIMEVCANPLGANGGNDASVLHTTVFWPGGRSSREETRTADLSLDFHVYAVDWRPDHLAFYLDGKEVARFTDATHIPNVAMPLILDLAVGGSWCGSSNSTTPNNAQLLVDWIRARP